jgi:hypothetical protein
MRVRAAADRANRLTIGNTVSVGGRVFPEGWRGAQGRSDLVIVFGSSRPGIVQMRFPLNLFELFADLVQSLLKAFGFDLNPDFAFLTGDVQFVVSLDLAEQDWIPVVALGACDVDSFVFEHLGELH